MRTKVKIVGLILIGLVLGAASPTQTKESDTARITNINAWTVGVAAAGGASIPAGV